MTFDCGLESISAPIVLGCCRNFLTTKWFQ